MLKRFLIPMLLLGLGILGAGCSENGSDITNNGSTGNDINSEFGGYTATNEAPAFGDAALLAESTGDIEYDDPILAQSGMDAIVADSNSGFYHLRMVWGKLRYDSTVTTATDWTGSLSITRGAEIIRRVIRFEPGQDYIVPRTDRRLIEWVSQTTVHNDGLAVDLLVPRELPLLDSTVIIDTTAGGDTVITIVVDTTFPNTPVEVSFETGPYSRTFSLAEIAELDTIVYLDDSNAVAFHGMRLHRNICPRGFLSGFWGFDEEGQGIFRGMWLSRHGFVAGYLEGIFGQNDDGQKVFMGKWIDVSGSFEGLLSGTYGEFPNMHANANAFWRAGGWFYGGIFSSNHIEIGALRGKWAHSMLEGGFFQGRWRTFCLGGGNNGRGDNFDDDSDEDD